jgi:hypothetical protein
MCGECELWHYFTLIIPLFLLTAALFGDSNYTNLYVTDRRVEYA